MMARWQSSSRMKRAERWRIVLASAGIAVLSLAPLLGCAPNQAARRTTPTAAPSPTFTPFPTATPPPAPTAFPVAAAVTAPAGSDVTQSPNWCGYSFPAGGLTGVRAQWWEPSATGAGGALAVVWVGIGGWDYTYNNIVQIGTFETPGATTHQVWYETLPPNHWDYTQFAVAPGDHLFASVTLQQAAPQTWSLLLSDATSGQSFSTTVQFASDQAYADFIVEDPDATSNNGPPYYPLPRFSPVTFTNMQLRYGGSWVSAGTIWSLRISLIQSGAVRARPGALAGTSFTVSQSS